MSVNTLRTTIAIVISMIGLMCVSEAMGMLSAIGL